MSVLWATVEHEKGGPGANERHGADKEIVVVTVSQAVAQRRDCKGAAKVSDRRSFDWMTVVKRERELIV
mgnify:CR=1 FL=1